MIHRETLVPERLMWGGGGGREGDAGGAAVRDFERSMCERVGDRREEAESLDGEREEEEEEEEEDEEQEEVVGSGEGGGGASSEVRGEGRSAGSRRGGLAVQFALMNVCASCADLFLAGDVDAREAEAIVREVYVYVYVCIYVCNVLQRVRITRARARTHTHTHTHTHAYAYKVFGELQPCLIFVL
jgi:hypothetical protein